MRAEQIETVFVRLDHWLAVLPPPPILFAPGKPLTSEFGTPQHHMASVEEAFRHFVWGRGISDEDHAAAERVFVYAVQTALSGSTADWKRLHEFANKIDSLSIRRAKAIGQIERAIKLINDPAPEKEWIPPPGSPLRKPPYVAWPVHIAVWVHVVFVNLRFCDQAFKDLSPEAIHAALTSAKPGKHKGGAGNRGAIGVTAQLALDVGALGFERLADAEPGEAYEAAREAAIKALGKSRREADAAERRNPHPGGGG